jgi:hypothetical protein
MPSITLMMLAILRLEPKMSAMVETTLATASLPRAAASVVVLAKWLACCAVSAFWRTDAVCYSMAAAASSKLEAVC